jgi:deoxyhypusine synthase
MTTKKSDAKDHGRRKTSGGQARACTRYLTRPRIDPVRLERGMTVVDLVGQVYARSGAFNGGRLAEACALFSRMIDDGATIAMTVSGAMTPAGMGGVITALMEYGFIDLLICTGANLYHDLHFALDLPVHQGDFRTNDTDLLEAGVVRIYDIFITEELLLATDTFVQDAMRRAVARGELKGRPGAGVSTARVHYALGQEVQARARHPEKSVVAAAARCGVPVYVSSPGDSSIGMNLAALKLEGRPVPVDPDLDVLETSALVLTARKNGVLEIGGGSPKNFYLQTQPTLSQILGIDRGGHDYFIQVTTDSPQWGGLSGATPGEAVTWGKINPNELASSVVVYCDATIALPLIGAYALSKHKKRPLKRLYDSIDASMETLEREARAKRGPAGAP